ncbi:MAG: DUF5011 domain-containing protein [Bacteroidales bacterium]|nr:DUF5011 domain-containing protein [Bacteroidales bacterium]
MKKYFSKLLMLAVIAVAFTACESDDTEGLTRTTYYATINLTGGQVVVNLGSSYSEPGYTAILNGQDVTDRVEVSSNINASQVGVYRVVYSCVNEDGFSSAVTRTVIVNNPGNFDNVYLAEVQNTAGTRHYYGTPTVITNNGDGTYDIDDLLTGYYWNGIYPGYEPTYDFHNEATLALNADNTISLVSESRSWYFGSSYAVALESGAFDPATGVITLTTDWPTISTLVPVE